MLYHRHPLMGLSLPSDAAAESLRIGQQRQQQQQQQQQQQRQQDGSGSSANGGQE